MEEPINPLNNDSFGNPNLGDGETTLSCFLERRKGKIVRIHGIDCPRCKQFHQFKRSYDAAEILSLLCMCGYHLVFCLQWNDK